MFQEESANILYILLILFGKTIFSRYELQELRVSRQILVNALVDEIVEGNRSPYTLLINPFVESKQRCCRSRL